MPSVLTLYVLVVIASVGLGVPQVAQARPRTVPESPALVASNDGRAEAKLIQIYRLIGADRHRDALRQAQELVEAYPHFQLAQLVYGDLLATQVRPVLRLGDVSPELEQAGAANLQALRQESQLRIAALQQRPPPDASPAQFIGLSKRNKHAIAVDTAKARLYLFENTSRGTKLIADYYISVGKAGVGKNVEGDQRTPLGVYFITSNLDPKSLQDLYGTGALPINYPNVLDLRRGKTGSGIWLHGTPSAQFSRAPLATDGCVAIANPDLDRIIKTVEIRTTPVLIGKNFTWKTPAQMQRERQQWEDTLRQWASAKSTGRLNEVLNFYATDFNAAGKDRAAFARAMQATLAKDSSKPIVLNDVSLIRWSDEAEIMVATFGELRQGGLTGRTVRQYWQKRADTWRIIYEGAQS